MASMTCGSCGVEGHGMGFTMTHVCDMDGMVRAFNATRMYKGGAGRHISLYTVDTERYDNSLGIAAGNWHSIYPSVRDAAAKVQALRLRMYWIGS